MLRRDALTGTGGSDSAVLGAFRIPVSLSGVPSCREYHQATAQATRRNRSDLVSRGEVGHCPAGRRAIISEMILAIAGQPVEIVGQGFGGTALPYVLGYGVQLGGSIF